MPVLASEEQIVPKSILRHRPIGDSSSPTGKRTVTTGAVPMKKRASRPRPRPLEHHEGDIAEWHYIGGNTGQKSPPQESKGKGPTSPSPIAPAPKPTRGPIRLSGAGLKGSQSTRYHPLLYLGVGMSATVLLWILFSGLSGWCINTLDTLRYGYPRTFQTDAWVGHNEQTGVPSHFIALNLKGHIEIIEFPGGDATHARVYIGPQLYGPNADLVPVTLAFADLNGDHKPDMIVTFQGSRIVFINDQGTFRSPLPAERPQIEKALQHFQ